MNNHHTTVSRMFSASAASWARILVTVGIQIVLVPLYLGSWDSLTYGAWLLLQAIWAVITIVDLAHHDYVGYECLRLGQTKRKNISHVISSSIPIVVFIAFWDILVAWQLGRSSFFVSWVGLDEPLLTQWNKALLLQAVTWLLTGSLGGLIIRWLTPFGYWPKFAWWAVASSVLTSVMPALAVIGGADILQAMIALCLTNLVYYFFFFWSMMRIVSKQGFVLSRPSLHQGISQGFHALWLVAKSLAEMGRQQGSRIILVPLTGVAEMSAFATMRTGANFALQGLNTITSPVMPELMRFLAVRDQPRTEGIFAIVWLVLCGVICPAIVVVQWLAPALFPLWTHGKIAFDPWLFGMLSLGVSVLALAQPAAAVLQGNNILREQLAISILAAAVAVGSMAWLVPLMGVRGAALALLAAELTSLAACVGAAQQWLQQQGMQWPWKAFCAAASALPVTAVGIVALELLPADLTLAGLALILLMQGFVAIIYWRYLPTLVRLRAASVLLRFLPAKVAV